MHTRMQVRVLGAARGLQVHLDHREVVRCQRLAVKMTQVIGHVRLFVSLCVCVCACLSVCVCVRGVCLSCSVQHL